jgi:hypothetical protein
MVVGLSPAAGRFLVGNGDGSGDVDAHKFDNMMVQDQWDGDQDGARSTGRRRRSRWCQINLTVIKMVPDQLGDGDQDGARST